MRLPQLLTVLEVVFLLAALVGVAFAVGWAVALIVGGAVGVVACEVAERRTHTAPARESR